jgi:hypothetical protein
MPICKNCGEIFPNRLIIDNKIHNLHKRKFCIKCSPFKSHNTSKVPPILKNGLTSKQYRKVNKEHKCLFCSKLTKRKKFCSRQCHGFSMVQSHIDEGSGVSNHNLRKYLIFLRGHECEECHNILWNNQPIPLETHHINGKYDDNRLINLKLQCPNCHALTDNYKAKNKGNGRPYSKYR